MDHRDFPSILLHGARGTGLWEALRQGAAGLLCERVAAASEPWRTQACGECDGCRLLRSGSHPDLHMVLPPALGVELGVTPAALESGADKRSAAGREITIDDVRALNEWAHATSHRGGVKVALVHPLDAMAAAAANALLKVLEEPPAHVCFLTGTNQLDRVLPTLRSRCRVQAWARPDAATARDELQRRGESDARAVACWCRHAVFDPDPARGLEWTRRLLRKLAAGEPASSDGVTPAVAIESLQKATLDVLRARAGLAPIYLPGLERELQRLGARGDAAAWQQWWQRLAQAARTAEFPLHGALAVQAWVVEWSRLCTSGNN